MNILLTSIGRRGLIVNYFRDALARNGGGKVYAADCDFTAPALHLADEYFIVPKITDREYLDALMGICQKKHVTALLSFIDPELKILAQSKGRFERIGTRPLVPDEDLVELCEDKYKTYQFLMKNNIPVLVTYESLEECITDLESSRLSFPLIMKPARGSASRDICKVDTIDELRFFSARFDEKYIIQRYLNTPEYGIDVLVDMEGKVTSVFMKRKLSMRAGETDKAVSVRNRKLQDIGIRIGELLRGPGPLDIDLFEKDDEFVVTEINPRFGGGYPLAHACGLDFMDLIIRMLQGKKLTGNLGDYQENVYYSKYDHIVVYATQ
ncbi:MAG: ATP-grasp domain-containing protein [Chloroflexi bacterium]|nr:ATP-grasp domain-containing protein [Chloroflexota bacterium]